MKKIKKITLALSGIMASCVFTSAIAVAPLPSGWYLEANGGGSRISNVNYASGSSLSTTGIAWNVNGGYKFSPFFAGELGYTRYSNTSSKVSGTKIATATYYSYDLSLKPILPIGDTGAEIFAKLGIARLNSNVKASNPTFAAANGITVSTGTNNATGYYFGLGGEYYFMPALAANLQWQRAKGNNKTGTLDLYSIGVSYLFG